ncbi:MAG: antibiotic biosynthesis monooxygenase family protein [Pseudomonadota bacterium]
MKQRNDNLLRKAMVRSTIWMLIPLDKQSEALDILGYVSAQVRYEPGCISSRLYRGVDDMRAIMVEELWTDNEGLLRHLQSDEYRRVLLVIEMAEAPPDIRFIEISHTSGLETIENALKKSAKSNIQNSVINTHDSNPKRRIAG